MNQPFVISRTGSDLTVTINVPLPKIGLPNALSKFPPKINIGSVPNPIPKALQAIGEALAYVIKVLEKLVSLIPDTSFRLVVKVGPATIFDQKISTDDLVGIPYT